MSHRTARNLRGWLLHDSRITLASLAANTAEDTTSDYTQTGARPGTPVASDELGTYLPHAHHGQAADLDVVCVAPGLPGEAGLAYRVDGEDDESYRGWCEPVLVLGYRPVEWSATDDWEQVDAVTCPVTQKVVATAVEASGNHPPSVWVWSPATRTWSSRIEPDADSAADLACVTVLRSTGRLLVFLGNSSTGRLSAHFSDDDGTSWSEYAPFSMPAGTLDSAVSELKCVEDKHGILLLLALDASSGDYWQYASRDAGASWELVEDSVASQLRSVSLAVVPGSVIESKPILVVYLTNISSAASLALSDAYEPLSDATVVTLDGALVQGALSCALDADGVAYALATEDQGDQVRLYRSVDGGASWELYEQRVLQLGGSVTDPEDHAHLIRACAWSGGELVSLWTSAHASAPSSDGSLVSLWLGGWSSLENTDSDDTHTGRLSWADPADIDGSGVFLPTATLEDQGWNDTGTPLLTDGYHEYSPAAGVVYDTLTTGGHTAGEFSVLFEARVVSGGSLSADDCSFHHERRNGTLARKLTIRFSTTGFRVQDASGSGTSLETVTTDCTQLVQVALVYGSDSAVTVFWKRPADSAWSPVVQASLGSDATALNTDVYEVGCRANTTSDFRVGMIAFGPHALRRGLEAAGSIGRLRWGRALSPVPYPCRDADEDGRVLHLSGEGGVARFHETWALPAQWDHGVREAHPVESPSPGSTWRSEDTNEQVLTWDLGSDTRLGSSWAVGLALVGANFRRAILEVSTASAPDTFVELGTWNTRTVVGGSFTLEGNLLIPAAGTSSGDRFYGADDLAKGFVVLDPNGTPVTRRIKGNSGGGWVGNGMQTVLELEDVDGTEPTSGTVHVHAPSGLLVVHQAAPTAYRRVRLRIPTQECPDSYFELGNLVLGSIFAIGRQWSRGWSFRWVPLTRQEEDERGTVFVEPRGDEEDVYRRELTVSWQDGYSDATIRQSEPPYLSASPATPPLVADQDVWRQVVGLLRKSKGGALPSCPILEIPAATTTITDPSLWGYGRTGVGGVMQANNVQGFEGRSEVYRFESVTWVELK